MLFRSLLMVTGKMNEVSSSIAGLSAESTQEPGQESSLDEDGSGKSSSRDPGEGTGGSGEDSPGEDGSGNPGEGKDPAGSGEDTSRDSEESSESEQKPDKIPAPDFELEDQFGQVHRLSDYKGKTVFLNFWATWCPPCRAEMPDIQKLYEEYDTEGDEAVIILGVAGPNMGNEKSAEDIAAFLDENGYTYPVVMDTTGDLFTEYGIYAFPTTFMIDREGNVFGYASGQLSYDMMKDIITQTMEGKRRK